MSTDQPFDMQAVLDKTMPLYIVEKPYLRSMCQALAFSCAGLRITNAEKVAAYAAIDVFMDYVTRHHEEPDSFLLEALAESGCENPSETALRIYQNWDERMTILHEATDAKESV